MASKSPFDKQPVPIGASAIDLSLLKSGIMPAPVWLRLVSQLEPGGLRSKSAMASKTCNANCAPTTSGIFTRAGSENQQHGFYDWKYMTSYMEQTRALTREIPQRDLERYSFGAALRSAAGGNGSPVGFEREVSQEISRKLGSPPNGGFWMPHEAFNDRRFEYSGRRDALVATATLGGNLVGTKLEAGSFIDNLRARVVGLRNATTLTGCVGNVVIPRLATSATVNWCAETVASTESNVVFAQVTLTPKCAAGFCEWSKDLAMQSTPDVESLLKNDIAQTIATTLEIAAINGAGGVEPTGILSLAGTNLTTIDTNGGALTYAHILEMERKAADNNAEEKGMIFLTNSKAKAKLKQTLQLSTATDAAWVWTDKNMVAGYRAFTTEAVPSNLAKAGGSDLSAAILADWTQCLWALWGALEIQINPFSKATTRIIQCHFSQYTDFAWRRPGAVSVVKDIVT